MLAPALHARVHDERIPREERALLLQAHYAGAGLGLHWTPRLRVAVRAIANAADGASAARGAWLKDGRPSPAFAGTQEETGAATDIIFHIARPGERNRLRNPGELRRYGIGRKFSQDEDEFAVKPGSPLRLTGISWRPHDPRYPLEPFEHADFPRPVRHVSAPLMPPGPAEASRSDGGEDPGPEQ